MKAHAYEWRYTFRAFMSMALVAVLLMASGCASSRGFDRGELVASVPLEVYEYDDTEIERMFAIEPQMTLPARIAVYFPGTGWGASYPKDFFLEAEEELRAAGVVSDLILIDNSLVEPHADEKAVRGAAARYGADAVFVIHDYARHESRANIASVLYLTVVGMWIVPGSHRDVDYTVSGTLIDTRNGFLYLSIESEAKGSTVGPLALVDRDRAEEKARIKAFEKFRAEFVERLTGKSFRDSLYYSTSQIP